jgi:hypothetical protein
MLIINMFMNTVIPASRCYFETPAKTIKLNLPIPHEEMLLEAKNLRDKFIPYRIDDGWGWHSLPIVGIGDDSPWAWTAFPTYTSGRDAAPDYKWTSHSELCPITVNWLKTVFPSNCYGRVRFMLLEAGGYIGPHRDSEHSVVEPINIALNNPENCVWHWNDSNEELHFKPGDIRAMNIMYTHSVRNNSNEDRYHIILHHFDSTPEWMELMEQSLKEHNEPFKRMYSTILM